MRLLRNGADSAAASFFVKKPTRFCRVGDVLGMF